MRRLVGVLVGLVVLGFGVSKSSAETAPYQEPCYEIDTDPRFHYMRIQDETQPVYDYSWQKTEPEEGIWFDAVEVEGQFAGEWIAFKQGGPVEPSNPDSALGAPDSVGADGRCLERHPVTDAPTAVSLGGPGGELILRFEEPLPTGRPVRFKIYDLGGCRDYNDERRGKAMRVNISYSDRFGGVASGRLVEVDDTGVWYEFELPTERRVSCGALRPEPTEPNADSPSDEEEGGCSVSPLEPSSRSGLWRSLVVLFALVCCRRRRQPMA